MASFFQNLLKPTAPPAAQQVDDAVQLYKYVQTARRGSWERVADTVSCTFYDLNADSRRNDTCWKLEVTPGAVDDEIDERMSAVFSDQEMRVTFMTADNDIWALKFPTAQTFAKFKDDFNNKLYENVHGAGNNDEFLNTWRQGSEPVEWDATDDAETSAPKYSPKRVNPAGDDAISIVRMGANERSYVVKGSHVEVLRNELNSLALSGQSFQITPPQQRTKKLTPSSAILMGGERRLNLLSPDKKDKVYNADIETGKVVAEWSFRKDGVDQELREIVNETKAAQLDDRSTFFGIGANQIARWDMRTPEGVVQTSAASPVMEYMRGHTYKGKVDFTCIATSGDGYVATGSSDGVVRLYNNTDKALSRASTNIPGLGAAVTAVDVTHDGNYVVATTDRYIMVICTMFRDKKGNITNGFAGRMGAANSPTPKLLRLKPEDVAYLGNQPFRKARFTWVTDEGRQERHIVASCGKATISWNFRQVKLAKSKSSCAGLQTIMEHYHIHEKDEDVVDSVTMHERYGPAAVVVATKRNLFSEPVD